MPRGAMGCPPPRVLDHTVLALAHTRAAYLGESAYKNMMLPTMMMLSFFIPHHQALQHSANTVVYHGLTFLYPPTFLTTRV